MTHFKDTVDLGKYLGSVDVSTLHTFDSGWETCLFFKDKTSLVVAWYPDGVKAIEGHRAFTQPDVLRHITNIHLEDRNRTESEHFSYCKVHDLFDCWLCPHLDK